MKMYRIPLAVLVTGLLATVSAFSSSQNETSKYKDGTYRGSSTGHVDEVTVEVTINEGRITDVKVVKHHEEEHPEAIQNMPQRIIGAQSTDGVDGVTGATITSTAILKATELALEKSLDKGTVSALMKVSITTEDTQPADQKKSLGAKTLLPTPVWVIGSYDMQGKPNMMTAAWVGICCSRPPCVTVSLRKATYTYGNIMERKAYTVNIPPEAFAGETCYFGRTSGRDVDKLVVTGLTPVKGEFVDAPYLQEFPFNVECEVIHTYEVGLHTMFIGEIKDVKVDESILGENDVPDVEKLKPFIFSAGRSGFYRTAEFLGTISELRKKIEE